MSYDLELTDPKTGNIIEFSELINNITSSKEKVLELLKKEYYRGVNIGIDVGKELGYDKGYEDGYRDGIEKGD